MNSKLVAAIVVVPVSEYSVFDVEAPLPPAVTVSGDNI